MNNQMDTNVTMSTVNAISNFTGIEELQGVRSFTDENGNPWFIANNLANILAIQNIRQNLNSLDNWQKGVSIVYTLGGHQEVNVINEAGLYQLIATSRKPEAREFMKWVYNNLLVKLRKKYTDMISGNSQQLIDVMTVLPPWVVKENNRRLQEQQRRYNQLYQYSKNKFDEVKDQANDIIRQKNQQIQDLTQKLDRYRGFKQSLVDIIVNDDEY